MQANSVTASEFAVKYRSKNEVFMFLTVDCRAYLCDASCLTVYFLKALVSGEKRCKWPLLSLTRSEVIRCDEVRYLFCPQYENLHIEDILAHLKKFDGGNEYLPDDRDIPKLPRQFLCNLAFTLIGDDFGHWVRDQIRARNDRIKESNKLTIKMDPEVAKAFMSSGQVSSK